MGAAACRQLQNLRLTGDIGTVVELQAVKVIRSIIPNINNKKKTKNKNNADNKISFG